MSVSPVIPARTKIIATVGPACRQTAQLAELIRAGADVFRLNMAHGTLQQHEEELASIREASNQVGQPVAVLVDLSGPKIRLGELQGGGIDLQPGETVRFVRGAESKSRNDLTATYDPLIDELQVGNQVLLADGTVSLVVDSKTSNEAVAHVVQPGLIRSRQGINLPGVKLSAPAMDDEDRQHAVWAAKHDIDYVGLSFVRQASDVHELKTLLREQQSSARVIAKVEKQEALDHLEEIVDAADGIMVARGDLGVEIDVARTPVEQKRIIDLCNRMTKPVIVATQMLDSMQHSRRPTRAEVTDVANAILDGCDACMLSGETAMGDHPVLVVDMMNRIAMATEPLLRGRPCARLADKAIEGLHRVTEAVVYGTGFIAEQLDAKVVVAVTHSGVTALALSKQRSHVPILGISDVPMVTRQMCLYWGVTPVVGAPARDKEELIRTVEAWGRRTSTLKPGDHFILVSAIGLVASGHNMMVVHQVRGPSQSTV
jgi:pyruvate kinase